MASSRGSDFGHRMTRRSFIALGFVSGFAMSKRSKPPRVKPNHALRFALTYIRKKLDLLAYLAWEVETRRPAPRDVLAEREEELKELVDYHLTRGSLRVRRGGVYSAPSLASYAQKPPAAPSKPKAEAKPAVSDKLVEKAEGVLQEFSDLASALHALRSHATALGLADSGGGGKEGAAAVVGEKGEDPYALLKAVLLRLQLARKLYDRLLLGGKVRRRGGELARWRGGEAARRRGGEAARRRGGEAARIPSILTWFRCFDSLFL